MWKAHLSSVDDAGPGPGIGAAVPVPAALLLLATLAAVLVHVPGSALPGYSIEVQPDDDQGLPASSGPRQASAHLSPASILRITLRPERVARGPIALRVFLEHHGQVSPYPLSMHRAPTGTFRLRVPLTSLPDLGPGSHTLHFLLGRPSAALDHYERDCPAPGVHDLQAVLHIRAGPSL